MRADEIELLFPYPLFEAAEEADPKPLLAEEIADSYPNPRMFCADERAWPPAALAEETAELNPPKFCDEATAFPKEVRGLL